jgi:hypothetical protein
MALYFAEITGDGSILEAEAKIMGKRRAYQDGMELGSANLSSLQVPASDGEVI